MKKVFVSNTFLLMICASSAFAQKAPLPPSKEKNQNIIIHKKSDKNEKTTIVIDGEKVTINGKPAEDYKDGDVEIMQNSDSDIDFFPPAAPFPPLPPHGGAKTFYGDARRSFDLTQNSAFLGVYSASDEDGATISSVTKNSPAAKAGLKEGDVITKVGTDDIDDANDLIEAIGKYKPNDKVTVTYKRDKKENIISVTLEKNKEQSFTWSNDNNHISMNGLKNFSFNWNDSKPRLGLRIQDVETGSGVKVIDINDDSPAAKAGLKENDVITQIKGKPVQSVKDATDILADVKPGDDIQIIYQRSGASQTATAHIPKPLQTSDL